VTQTDRPLVAYTLALALAAGLVLALFPLQALFPAHPLDTPLVGDGAVSAIGQRYFLAAPWAWPLLHVDGPGGADGIHIGLTDSIPLAMLLLKPFRAMLPPGFFVQTLWVALAWLLQPAAAVYALRGTGERRVLPCLAAALLAISLPSLLLRFGHMALCTHGAILVSLGLYLRLCRPGAAPRLWTAGAVLMLLCLLVHPYILLMAAAVLGAVPLTLLLRRDRRWPGAGLRFGASFALVVGAAKLLGYGGTQPAPGFGYYSMNLFGPFVPSFSTLFGDRAPDATGGQVFEGMQYLGAGLLLLLAIAGPVALRRRYALGQHAGLIAVLVALTAFSLSADIYAGHHLLLHAGGVPAAVAQFRSTGRFFWPVAYAGMIAGVVAVAAGGSRPRLAYAVLAVCCVLQLDDTAGLRRRVAQQAAGDAWAIDAPALVPVFAAHTHLTLWPSFGCGATAESPVDMQVLLIASRTLMPTNTMFSARERSAAECGGTASLARPLEAGELRVIHRRVADAWAVPDAERHCRLSGEVTLCSLDDGALQRLTALPLETLALNRPQPLPSLVAEHLLRTGWSQPEPVGTWTEGDEAVLRFRQPLDGRPHRIRLDGMTVAPTPGGTQAIALSAGDAQVTSANGGDMTPATLTVKLPSDRDTVTLTLHIAHPIRPADRGMGADERRLGFMLKQVTLEE
jgi:hypothetical protein